MPFRGPEGLNVRFLRYGVDGKLPVAELKLLVQEKLRGKNRSRVAIMADDEEAFDVLKKFDVTWLDPRDDYNWSGWKYQMHVGARAKRVVAGRYDHWFQWYMRTQRFRAFHTVVFIDPAVAFSDAAYGGYLDGLFARLLGKTRQVIVVNKPDGNAISTADEVRTKEVLRALLYGTRLSTPLLLEHVRLTLVPIPEDVFAKALGHMGLHARGSQTRYQLDPYNENLLQAMVPRAPLMSEEGEPGRVESFFKREKRFRAEARIPDKILVDRAFEDVGKHDWTTVPAEAKELQAWLLHLNEEGDPRIRRIYESMENPAGDQGVLLSPRRIAVREILDGLTEEGKLEKRTWYREVGRPALAYSIPGKAPFLDRRCGQCAFYVPDKRRCRLWWLANKTAPFFHPRWKEPSSKVAEFELHKMKYASRIAPRSSACLRFLDKKRDYLWGRVPERCKICRRGIPTSKTIAVTCQNCKTRYVRRWDGRVRVLTAYEHEFDRIYQEATGGDPKADLEAWKKKAKEDLMLKRQMSFGSEEFDALAEEVPEPEHEPPRIHLGYSSALQERVDHLVGTTDIVRQMSIAMVQSAYNATRRIATFAKLYSGDASPIISKLEMYLALMAGAPRAKFLPYEALSMKQYWAAYGLALRSAQLWAGPRKRSRFVMEFVEDPAGKARGYSPMDAAINYLHQRRLRQAERINREVGFPGTCDGFLHRERYKSRGIGLLLDMIDPFKFVDREELLLVALDQGLTWKDFQIETDRRGSNFYYPRDSAVSRLDQIGLDADSLGVTYRNREVGLGEAYKLFAEGLLGAVQNRNGGEFVPFVLEFQANA